MSSGQTWRQRINPGTVLLAIALVWLVFWAAPARAESEPGRYHSWGLIDGALAFASIDRDEIAPGAPARIMIGSDSPNPVQFRIALTVIDVDGRESEQLFQIHHAP